MSGAATAAIVGPEMVKRTNALIPDHTFLATYLYLPLLPIITAILLSFVEVPPAQKKTSLPIPFRVIFARPNFITAVVSSLVGYGTRLGTVLFAAFAFGIVALVPMFRRRLRAIVFPAVEENG